MMDSMTNDFYVDDESPEEIRQSLKSGAPVVVIPSRLRRDFRMRLGKLLKELSDDLGRAAERVGTPGTAQARAARSRRAAPRRAGRPSSAGGAASR
jgi:hypothetical protein